MLQAKTKRGTIITLAIHTLNEIKALRKRESFYCPTCEEKVIPRAGTHTIPHFAHYGKSQCESILGGESAYHEKGKLTLYKWLIRHNISVSLERYLPDIKRRPDLYFEINNRRIVIEFQCARVPVVDIQKRNKDYKSIGITPLWILGAKQFQRLGRNHIKVDSFTLQFIHRFNPTPRTPYFIYFFCPETEQFLLATNLIFVNTNKALASLHYLKINRLSFHHLFQKRQLNRMKLIKLWEQEKYKFRTSYHRFHKGREMLWYQWLYHKNTHVHYLPREVYLPVEGLHLFKSSVWNWQSRICLDIIHPLKVGNKFSVLQCYNLLHSHLYPDSYYPLISSNEHPIVNYLEWLVKLSIVERISSNWYRKVSDLIFYKSIEEAIHADKALFYLQKS